MKINLKFCLGMIVSVICSNLWAAEVVNFYNAPQAGERLTPEISLSPSINGASAFAVKAGCSFVHRIPISGERPFRVQIKGLPEGVSYDQETGILNGIVQQEGDYQLTIEVKNKLGKHSKIITMRCGKVLLLTPPLCWNSWYSYSEAISQDAIEKIALLFHTTGLADHGWSYVNIDDCWQGERGGKLNALQGNERFPDMKKMCDYVHNLGLKVGLYSTPWVSTYAGFRGGSLDSKVQPLPEDKRLQKNQLYGRWPGLHRLKADHTGEWLFDKDVQQWAEWGFDYVKVDWKPNDVPTTKKIFENLSKVNRIIILSLSNAAPYENMEGLSQYANVTRTTGDIHDSWGSIKGIGFSQERWQKYLKPGHFPDPDMLQIGKIGTPNQYNTKFRQTRLTCDEQYTQVTLWALLSAPLIISSNLEELDSFTKGLICNDEVLAINQDIAVKPAKRVFDKEGLQIWTKELDNGDLAVGFFNLNDQKKIFKINLELLNLQKRKNIRDIWRQKDIGVLENDFSIELNRHGATLFRLSK